MTAQYEVEIVLKFVVWVKTIDVSDPDPHDGGGNWDEVKTFESQYAADEYIKWAKCRDGED